MGLDRKLWTWDVNTKRMIDCVYLRQRLNCLLVCDDEGWETAGGGDEEEGMTENGGGDWENETDHVQDYVDSDDGDDNGDSRASDSGSNDTKSESSGEETESSEENEESPCEEISSDGYDDEEEDVTAPKSDTPKKKRRING